MTIIIVHQPQLVIIVLAAPLDRLLDCTVGRYLSVGGVGVGGSDVASSPVYLPHVLGQIPTVGVPGGILLDGQGAGGYGLGGVPGDEPQARLVAAQEVAARDLQVAPVGEAMVEGDSTVLRHLLGGTAAQRSAQTGAAGSGGAVVVHGEVLPPPPAGGASRLCCGGVLHAWSSSTYNTPAGGKHRKKMKIVGFFSSSPLPRTWRRFRWSWVHDYHPRDEMGIEH